MDTLLRTLALCFVAVAAVSACSDEELRCKTEFGDDCVDLIFVCNGIKDCIDNSDENQCGSPRTCPANYFACPNGRCIPSTWVCDGRNNCRDADGGSDERNCEPHHCAADEFACQTTRRDQGCIPRRWVCDGDHGDCVDDSDEQNCASSLAPATQENVSACSDEELRCKTRFGDDCVDLIFVCNRIKDCADNSDENQCGSPRTCPANYFACPNGRCIPSTWVCDGRNNCRDADGGSDERNCEPHHCAADEFACQTTRRNQGCIPRRWVCDGDHGDCVDDSDELNCGPSPNTTTPTLAPVTPATGPNTTTSTPAAVTPGTDNSTVVDAVTVTADKPAVTDAVPQTPGLGGAAVLARDDVVRLELPSWLATDQDAHFALSLVPMLRARAPRDKLDAQMAVLRLFRDLARN